MKLLKRSEYKNILRMASVLLFAFSLASCDSKEQTALGTIERDRIVLIAPANELIVDLPITEGSFVKEGTLLVKLDDRRQSAKVAKANAELAQASAQWEALRNGARIEDIDVAKANVDGAEANLTVEEKNYQRAVEIRNQQLGSQAALDQATASRDSARAALKSAQKHLLALTNGTRKESLDQAEAAYNAAKAQLTLEQYQLEELNISATRDGYLDSLPWNKGERVASGSPVAILLADKSAFARVYIPETYRAQIKVGDELQVRVDGIQDSIPGRLRWISNEPAFTPYFALNQHDRSRLVYLAEIDIQSSMEVPLGLPAEVLLPTSTETR